MDNTNIFFNISRLISDSNSLALDFYEMIVDSGFALINHHLIEISSSKSSCKYTELTLPMSVLGIVQSTRKTTLNDTSRIGDPSSEVANKALRRDNTTFHETKGSFVRNVKCWLYRFR